MANIKKKLRLFIPRFRTTVKMFGLIRGLKCIYLFFIPYFLNPIHSIYWKYLYYTNNSRFILKEIHGNKMYLNLQDKGISKDLAINKTREELQTELVMNKVKEGMHVLDLGANIGYYALIEASLVGPKGKVYAIEPSQSNFDLLNKNIGLNQF